jgi:hypothetical protein
MLFCWEISIFFKKKIKENTFHFHFIDFLSLIYTPKAILQHYKQLKFDN